MFIAILTYKKSLEKVDELLEEHKLYLDKNYNLGNYIFSGRRNPRVGGVILINNDSKNHIMEIIKEDPFFKFEIADYELIEFSPQCMMKSSGYLLIVRIYFYLVIDVNRLKYRLINLKPSVGRYLLKLTEMN